MSHLLRPGGASVWAITPEERGKHDKQFDTLTPVLGYVSGEQARKFFLQSGLPASVLAEIWNLADMDSDGKMDRLEFSIAMKLIKLTLQGRNLPPSLPVIMKQPPASNCGSNIPTSARFGNLKVCEIFIPMFPAKFRMGSMPNLSVGVSSMSTLSAMPILTPIPANPPMPSLQPLMPTALTLPLVSGSNSSSTTSLASNSPKMSLSDWAVPQASRLKYRQQFNTLDKLMSGYLSGSALTHAPHTHTPHTETLADVDKDGQLRADEFILAMHLVDMAKTGRPLPLTLPQDLDKLKENFARGSAELEKRRLALEEEQRKERARREREEREAQERREREAREQENRRRLEEERRLERQREMERQLEEERMRELERKEAAKLELERQRREEWERGRKEELLRRREGEQEEISRLRARKKSLELELEAGNKHKQISDRLRDAQSKRRILKAEVDLVNQTRDARIAEINTLQLEFENWQKKLSELVPEQQRLTEKLGGQVRMREQRYSDQPSVHSFSFCTKTALKICFVFTSHRLEKLEQERREQERREQEERERVEEEARQRRLLEEQRARQREEEEREAHARLRAAQEKAQEEERRRREAEEEEEKRKRQEAEEERKRKEEEEEKRRKEEQEREEQLASQLTTYKALYSFVARNADELSIEADCLIEVDEHTVGEPGWLCGRYGGNRGWFPQSYAEKCPTSSTTGTAPSSPGQRSSLPPPLNTSRTENRWASSYYTPSAGPLLARALSSWSPTSENHLTLSPGDAIQVLQQREDWWLGQLNGTQGWFPRSYVALETDEKTSISVQPAVKKNRWSPALNPALSAFFFFFFPCSEYVALYTYESPEVGDLTFVEGDVVMVTEREGEWWRGCIGDQTGVFPSNYVRPVEPEAARLGALTKKPEIAQAVSTTAAPTTHQLRLSPGQLIKVLAKNSSGWWLGELQARGKKRQRGWFHSANVKLLGPSCSKSSPSPLPVCQVIAMYNYTAANQDELSFSKGQLITILDKTNPDWWKGEAGGVTGLLPTNYVKMTTDSDPSQQWCADLMTLDSMTPQERKRQGYIHELIQTEENYVEDLELVLEVFYKPMAESGRLTEAEMAVIFVNWRELIMCNTRLLKALRVRKKTGGENMPVQLIGDLLASELAHMQPYSRFCSCQLNAAALLQSKTHSQPDFKDFLKKIATNYRCKGMPLSSFLLKPMQRITRYPLLIKNILEHTPDNHADRVALLEALDRAEELCSQVNEGVREKENSDRLEWIQSHVQCEGPIEHLVFNSLTNCLGPRKLLHSGRLSKTKSSRELWAFLFNDFLLLTHSAKPFLSSGSDKLFSPKTSIQLKMYKTPLFLNEVLVKMPADPSSDEPLFHVSHIDRVYTLKTETLNERTAWVQKIKAASEHFIETEKKKREKAYQARSLKTSGIGRLLVTVTEAQELKACKPNGKSNPYCELTMGAQCYTSRPISDTLNPKWNFNCQFFIKDLYQDVLCITVFEKDQFSPDDFLGRTEVPVATIKNEMESKGAANRRLLLHEVPTGEVSVKLDLQLYEPAK
uniref:Intersectin 2a n=1 Tax=Salarias fasciatus TaxID=181472 RepID=A0A672HJY5_SALFA